MLTKKHNQRISYISRILALPLFAFIVFAFTIKTKAREARNTITLENEITVVIDAGHGGGTGARADGYMEDDLALQIAKAVKNLNYNDKIKILLTRENEQNVPIQERVEFARKNNADLFVSIHINANQDPSLNTANSWPQGRSSGYEVSVSNKEPAHQAQSELLGAALVQELSKVYKTVPTLIKRQKGVWVLDANTCPAVLIECGYITDKKDRDFIIKKENQQLVAQKILKAIEVYATSQNATGKVSSKYNFQEQNSLDTSKPVRITLNTETFEDTVDQNFLIIIDGVEKGRRKDFDLAKLPADKIASMSVFKGEEAIKKYGDKGKQGVIEIITKKSGQGQTQQNQNANSVNIRNIIRNVKNDSVNNEVQIRSYGPLKNSDDALLIIDGVEKGKVKDLAKHLQNDQVKNVADQIESINVYTGDEAIKKFGSKGVNGVVVVTLHANVSVNTTQKLNLSNSVTINADTILMEKKSNQVPVEVLLIIDGKEIGIQKNVDIEKMVEPNIVQKVSVYKGKEAIEKYGEKGKQGVIEITTDKK